MFAKKVNSKVKTEAVTGTTKQEPGRRETGTEEAGRSNRRSWKQELSEAGSRNFGS
jgi:hypothetical protein